MSLHRGLREFKFPEGLTAVFVVFASFVVIAALWKEGLLKYKGQGVSAQTADVNWYMAGANPQRTSWVAEQVPATNNGQWDGLKLYPQWSTPLEGYIPHKIQVIAGNNTIFVSNADGVYAFDAASGTLKWVYPMDMPAGQSPTYIETSFGTYSKRLYIPGMDHKIHAIDADPNVSTLPSDGTTGQKVNDHVIWTYEAGAGFETNPLVVTIGGNLTIFAGNRDFYEYALTDLGSSVALAWKYKAAAPILFSSAISRDLKTVYFASLDNGAYGLNTTTGAVVWNQNLQGGGFYSYWPVVYNDLSSGKEYVIFNGSVQYRFGVPPGVNGKNQQLNVMDRAVFGGADVQGITAFTPVGPRQADGTLDISKDYNGSSSSLIGITSYLENNPQRRTVFVLDAITGVEKSFDINSNGKADYAPFIWQGTQSGNRYPALISGASGQENTIYSSNGYYYTDWINRGGVSGWRFGTQFLSTPEPFLHAVDEPEYYAGGGNLIYWAMHQNTAAGVTDISKSFSVGDNYKSSDYWNEGSCGTSPWPCLHALIPNYDVTEGGLYFGGANGNYGRNGDGNPPIPYNGKVYFQEGNSLIAFSTSQTTVVTNPEARKVAATNFVPTVTSDQLKQKLADEVQKIISAGHLRPGFANLGLVNEPFASKQCGDNLQDYFSNPSDIIITLARAVPYLPTGVYPGEATKTWTQKVQDYLTSEMSSNSPVNVAHIGFSGSQRDYYSLLPEIASDIGNPGNVIWTGFNGWSGAAPHGFYALWMYAKAMNYDQSQAQTLLNNNVSKLKTNPPPTAVGQNIHVLNSYIDGYIGFCGLERMADPAEPSCSLQPTLDSLLLQRATNFTKDVAWSSSDGPYCRTYTPSKNFIYLTPELGQYLHDNALSKVQAALDEYYHNSPYWFQEGFEDGIGENVFTPFYDTNLLMARAYVLGESQEELVKYLDTPMFAAGDLFYINNLIAAIEAPSASPTRPPLAGDINDSGKVNAQDLSVLLSVFGSSWSVENAADPVWQADLNDSHKVNAQDLSVLLSNFGRISSP